MTDLEALIGFVFLLCAYQFADIYQRRVMHGLDFFAWSAKKRINLQQQKMLDFLEDIQETLNEDFEKSREQFKEKVDKVTEEELSSYRKGMFIFKMRIPRE